MVLIDVIPLSKPAAISEILILMIAATVVGWLIARWITNNSIQGIQEQLLRRQTELDACRNSQPDSNLYLVGLVRQTRDDLKMIEGIGRKIEGLLNAAGILTFAQLAETEPVRITEILLATGSQYQIHDPSSWPRQSALARDGKWEALRELQDRLDGGRIV